MCCLLLAIDVSLAILSLLLICSVKLRSFEGVNYVHIKFILDKQFANTVSWSAGWLFEIYEGMHEGKAWNRENLWASRLSSGRRSLKKPLAPIMSWECLEHSG